MATAQRSLLALYNATIDGVLARSVVRLANDSIPKVVESRVIVHLLGRKPERPEDIKWILEEISRAILRVHQPDIGELSGRTFEDMAALVTRVLYVKAIRGIVAYLRDDSEEARAYHLIDTEVEDDDENIEFLGVLVQDANIRAYFREDVALYNRVHLEDGHAAEAKAALLRALIWFTDVAASRPRDLLVVAEEMAEVMERAIYDGAISAHFAEVAKYAGAFADAVGRREETPEWRDDTNAFVDWWLDLYRYSPNVNDITIQKVGHFLGEYLLPKRLAYTVDPLDDPLVETLSRMASVPGAQYDPNRPQALYANEELLEQLDHLRQEVDAIKELRARTEVVRRPDPVPVRVLPTAEEAVREFLRRFLTEDFDETGVPSMRDIVEDQTIEEVPELPPRDVDAPPPLPSRDDFDVPPTVPVPPLPPREPENPQATPKRPSTPAPTAIPDAYKVGKNWEIMVQDPTVFSDFAPEEKTDMLSAFENMVRGVLAAQETRNAELEETPFKKEEESASVIIDKMAAQPELLKIAEQARKEAEEANRREANRLLQAAVLRKRQAIGMNVDDEEEKEEEEEGDEYGTVMEKQESPDVGVPGTPPSIRPTARPVTPPSTPLSAQEAAKVQEAIQAGLLTSARDSPALTRASSSIISLADEEWTMSMLEDDISDVQSYPALAKKAWPAPEAFDRAPDRAIAERAVAVLFLLDKHVQRFKARVIALREFGDHSDDTLGEIRKFKQWLVYRHSGDDQDRLQLIKNAFREAMTRGGKESPNQLSVNALRNVSRALERAAFLDTDEIEDPHAAAYKEIIGPLTDLLKAKNFPRQLGTSLGLRGNYEGHDIAGRELDEEFYGPTTIGQGRAHSSALKHYASHTKMRPGNARATRYVQKATTTHVTTKHVANGDVRRYTWSEFEDELAAEVRQLETELSERIRDVPIEVPQSVDIFYKRASIIQQHLEDGDFYRLVHTQVDRSGPTAGSSRLPAYQVWLKTAPANILAVPENPYAPYSWRACVTFVVQVEDHGPLLQYLRTLQPALTGNVYMFVDMIGDYTGLIERFPGSVMEGANEPNDHFMLVQLYLLENDARLNAISDLAFAWVSQAATAMRAAASMGAGDDRPDGEDYVAGWDLTNKLANLLAITV